MEGEGGCKHVGPSMTPMPGPAPTRNAVSGEIPLLRCLFPGISSWEFSPVPKPPAARGLPSQFPAQHRRSPATWCRHILTPASLCL